MASETVVGTFINRAEAEAAIQLLREHGFAVENVGLVIPGEAGAEEESPNAAAEAATGGVLGGIGGLLLGVGLLAIPGVGPVLAAGPLLTALGGAALGAGTGLAAALTNEGVEERHATHLEKQVREGRVLVTVASTPRHEEIRSLLRQAGATETDFSLIGDEA